MWESIKNFFGFGKKEQIAAVVEVRNVSPVKAEVKTEITKNQSLKKSKAAKTKHVEKSEAKITAKDIKAKVKKEEPKVKKTSKPSKAKSKTN